MSIFSQIDLMARGGSLALLALWCWLLIRDHRNVLAARIGVLMNIAIACYLVVTAGWGYHFSWVSPIFTMGASATPGLFWLFARTWFNDEKRIGWSSISLVLFSVLNMMVMHLTFTDGGMVNDITSVMFHVGMLAFAGAGLWEAWRGRGGDLIEGRRRLRPRIVAAVGSYVIIIALTEIAVFNYAAPRWVIGIVGSSIVLITLLFCAAMFGMRQADLFGAVDGSEKPSASKLFADGPLAEKLHSHMDRELAWRDDELSIAALAAQLGEQEYRLRRVINGQLGHRNFAAFLNGYRLAEVKNALADPTQMDVPIITIALDAGFGSLGPFNRAFREAEGITPSEYRAAHAGGFRNRLA